MWMEGDGRDDLGRRQWQIPTITVADIEVEQIVSTDNIDERAVLERCIETKCLLTDARVDVDVLRSQTTFSTSRLG